MLHVNYTLIKIISLKIERNNRCNGRKWIKEINKNNYWFLKILINLINCQKEQLEENVKRISGINKDFTAESMDIKLL